MQGSFIGTRAVLLVWIYSGAVGQKGCNVKWVSCLIHTQLSVPSASIRIEGTTNRTTTPLISWSQLWSVFICFQVHSRTFPRSLSTTQTLITGMPLLTLVGQGGLALSQVSTNVITIHGLWLGTNTKQQLFPPKNISKQFVIQIQTKQLICRSLNSNWFQCVLLAKQTNIASSPATIKSLRRPGDEAKEV